MPDSKKFEGILDRYFETSLSHSPIFATHVGLKSGEGKLDQATLESEVSQEKLRRKTLCALESISPRELSAEQHLDRLALRSQLLHECEDFANKFHSLDPGAIGHVLSIFLHELQRGEDEPSRAARNIHSLLKQTPRYLSQASSLIKRPERVWRKTMQDTAAGAGELFDAVKIFLRKQGSHPQDARLIDSALKSVKKYKETVLNKPLAPSQSFAVGATILQRRIRDDLGLDYSLAEIESLANSEIQRIGALLKHACSKFGRNRNPDNIIAEARASWKPSKDLLSLYQEETFSIAKKFRNAQAVSFPKHDELDVRPVPDFMRSLFPTAAYSSPGAFERRQRGIFWVNDLSLTKKTEKEKRQEQAQHFGLSLTCAHEAYPGHHLQFVTANRHPRRWRRLFAHAIFYEGWTLWCEQMVIDLKIRQAPWIKIQQLHDALWRCHRILVDLRLQTKQYTYEQAVHHMQKHLGFTQGRAQADVNWYTHAPGVPMSYWLGRLENARLHKRLVEGRGWSLKKFNDWLISFGTIPQSWIEKYGLD
jgi:uncharacterized protein (DUF885 family)